MVLAAAVLLFQLPFVPGAISSAKPVAKALEAPLAAVATSDDRVVTAPAPVAAPGNAAKATDTPATAPLLPSSAVIVSTGPNPGHYVPPPPAFRPQAEITNHPSRTWYVLMTAQHGAATFDAWSTREGISQGRIEADPLMRPFAHSAAIYGAIQVLPTGLDYLSRRMQRSAGWSRHVWWLPQSLATATYLFSGSYNVAHSR